MTEAQMRKRHGWTAESKMPARYVHLVNADVDEAIFEHYGIEKKGKTKENLPKICKICDVPNSPESKICSKCGKPLDLEAALKMEQVEKEQQQTKIKHLEEQVEKIRIGFEIMKRAKEQEKNLKTKKR